jgi:apolipoprotein N-acyltransferase
MADRQVDHRVRGRRRRIGAAAPHGAVLAAAAASGVLLWAASPAVAAGWLAWVALVPAATVALAAPGTPGARLALPLAYVVYLELLLVPSLPFGIAAGQWGEPPLPVMIADSPVIAVALVAVPLAGALLWLVRFGEPWLERGALATVVVPALAWTALDVVRAKADPGGLWGPLFLSQHAEWPGRLAGLAGPWLLTFTIVAANYGLALVLARGRSALPGLVLAAALLAAAGAAQLGGASAAAALPRLTVAAVQPGYDTAEEGRRGLRHFAPGSYDIAALDMIRDLGGLTRAAAARGAVLVVWPEAAIWVDLRRDERVRVALGRLAVRTGAAIVVPFFLPDPAQGATVLVTPGGALSATQPKQRPMWFLGEDGGNRRDPAPVRAPGGRLGTLLGVDDQDPASGRRLAASGATVLASSTHDWKQLAVHHRAHARLQAIATGAPLVRADWRYGSAIYDRDGRQLASTGSAKRRAVLVAQVRPAGGRTGYTRVGDAPAWLAAAAATLAWLAIGRRRRRDPRVSQGYRRRSRTGSWC